MVDTGYYYPAVVVSHHDATPYWSNPGYIQDAECTGVDEGETNTGSFPHATLNMTSGVLSDGLRSTDYGFTIPGNSRIDGVTGKTVRSGAFIRDFITQLYVYNPLTGATTGLANKAKHRARTDGYFLVDTYGSTSDLWGASSLTPEQLNSGAMGLWWRGAHNDGGVKPAWHHCLALKVEYTNPTYSLVSTLPDVALQGDIISYNITLEATNSIDQGVPIPVEVPIPAGFTLLDYFSSGDYDTETDTWTPVLDENYEALLVLVVQCTGSGLQSQTVTETEFSTTVTDTCNILTSDVGDVHTATALIDDSITLANLEDGETYTLSAYMKLHDTGYAGVYTGIYNHRIAVVNGDELLGSRVTTQDTYQRVAVSFVYDDTENLTLKLYGQYEGVSTVDDEYWAGFALKKGSDSTYTAAGNLLADPDALLGEVTPTPVVLPASEESAEYRYTFPVSVLSGDNPKVTGLELSLVCEDTDGVEVVVTVASSSGATGDTKSSTLSGEFASILFGDDSDLWGLLTSDIIGQELIFDLSFNNTTLSEITPSFSNLLLTVYYYEDVTEGWTGLTYNGEHSSTYRANLTSNSHDVGAEVDLKTLNLTGRDGELITGSDIKLKEIKEEFIIEVETLEEGYSLLRDIKGWLSNERNTSHIPIPCELVFDYEPDLIYLAIVDGVIAVELDYPLIKCEVTFLIPDGLAYIEQSTGSVGTNNGLNHPRPVVTMVCDGSSAVVLTESEESQVLTINHTISNGTVITIDCEERTVIDSSDNDLTGYVSLDSIWPVIYKEYDFSSSTGGLIQGVTYREGY
ncbi:hypothetical protein FGU46_03335 [Methanobacterium sp. CWC-01]|uniref:distal tail protein Dit n=1 Tax=Methanobacterium aridiramus TaxID=2584467 RepID=UPI00257748E9|nr:distal tail protein Dit [Methanobacterium sp. CWC-01]WJI09193.1 hypothetical protein FGU46_03335 [Methanobacterium sp. CWC-01]